MRLCLRCCSCYRVVLYIALVALVALVALAALYYCKRYVVLFDSLYTLPLQQTLFRVRHRYLQDCDMIYHIPAFLAHV